MSESDDELLDVDLHEEITLVGDVVAAVAGHDGPLDEEAIDRALGVSPVQPDPEAGIPSGGSSDGAA